MKNIEAEISDKAIATIKDALSNTSIGMLITHLANDTPSVCPMTVKHVADSGCIWFLSTKNSEHFDNIEKDNKLLLTFTNKDDGQYLSITGKGMHSDNKSDIDKIWSEDDAQWYENGREDKNIVVLCILVTKAYYWDTTEQKSKDFE